jgi:glyoxylase-like metal-dependent hydrolase (beta-lactamase superfamily II)
VRRLLPALLGVVLATLASCQQELKLTVVRYGTSMFPAEGLFQDGEGEDGRFAWMFYVLEGGGRTVLIDTGFTDQAMARAYGVDAQDPLVLLHQLGIAPESVTDVVITHGHFDHIGNADRFPKARVWIQKDALDDAIDQNFSPSFQQFLRTSPQLRVVRGTTKLWDGLTMELVGGHSPGSCAIWIGTGVPVLLTGDECYVPENWQKRRPSGRLTDVDANLPFLDRALEAHMKGSPVWTMHEPDLVPKGQFFTVLWEGH